MSARQDTATLLFTAASLRLEWAPVTADLHLPEAPCICTTAASLALTLDDFSAAQLLLFKLPSLGLEALFPAVKSAAAVATTAVACSGVAGI